MVEKNKISKKQKQIKTTFYVVKKKGEIFMRILKDNTKNYYYTCGECGSELIINEADMREHSIYKDIYVIKCICCFKNNTLSKIDFNLKEYKEIKFEDIKKYLEK